PRRRSRSRNRSESDGRGAGRGRGRHGGRARRVAMPGMSPGLNVTDHSVVSAFRAALLHQGLLALALFALLAAARVILRRRLPGGARADDRSAASGRLAGWIGAEPAGRLVLTVGFGNLWLFDGFLQMQPKMALGLPSMVVEPTTQGS